MNDFDQFVALGDIIFAERRGHIVTTTSGLAIPENAQTPIWIVLAVGPKVTDSRIAVGERIMFSGGNLIPYDNRTFIVLRESEVLGLLPVPEEKLVQMAKPTATRKLVSLQ